MEKAVKNLGSDSINRKLAQSVDSIGVTGTHKWIIFLILIGLVVDVFEQNALGIIGPSLREVWGITATDLAFINSVTFVAMALGRFASGYLSDLYGRKTLLIINLLIFTIGAVLSAVSPNLAFFIISRFIVGFGLGGELTVALAMMSEISPTRFRGSAVGLVNVGAGGFGNLLAPGLGFLVLGTGIFGGVEVSWRWFFVLLVLPVVLAMFLRRYIPETPRFLISKGKIQETNRVLSHLASGRLNPKDVKVKNYLTEEGRSEIKKEKVKLSLIFRGQLAKNTILVSIAQWMTVGSQISILLLMPTILVSRGYDIADSLLFTMTMQIGSLLGAVGATVFGYFLQRKVVLIGGAVLAFISALAFGFLSTTLPLILIIGAIFQFFVLLLNTTIWLYAPELYPTRIRAFGTAFITTLGSLSSATMPIVAGLLLDKVGFSAVFILVACMYVVFGLVIIFAPETFGRSLEDLSEEYEQNLNVT